MAVNGCQRVKGTSLVPGHAHAEVELELTQIDNYYNSGEWDKDRTQRELILWADRNNGTLMLPALFAALK